MNMKFFLTAVLLLSVWGCVFAQMPRSSKQEYRRLSKEVRIKDSLNNTFEHLSLDKPDGSKHRLRGSVEKHIIARGDTNRIKYVFEPGYLKDLVVEGVRDAILKYAEEVRK